MAAPTKGTELLELVRKSGLLDQPKIDGYVTNLESEGAVEEDPAKLASRMVKDGLITIFQARQMLRGRYRGFFLGKYKVLEPIGSGGMADVYLCEHISMKHKVAVKILPIEKLKDPSLLGRFKREAQAIAALNHPNVVRAFDLDNEGNLHYLVTEYVDGCNLQDYIKKNGPIAPERAANFIAQAAAGLQHIQEADLVHRDIKPGNLLLDRSGVVKLLDLGLARFSDLDRQDNLTRDFDDGRVLGTADYIAPEQGIKGSDVDIRADIYSLGATFYFMIKGEAPFEGASVTQKLLFHQIKEPPPLPDTVPPEIVELIKHMMAKKPDLRVQTPEDVVERLMPYAGEIMAPPEEEMPPRAASLGAQPKTGGPKSSARLSSRMMSGMSHAGPPSNRGLDPALRSTPRSGVNITTKTGQSGALIPDLIDDEPDGNDRLTSGDEEEPSFLLKYKWPLIGGTLAILLGSIYFVYSIIASSQQVKNPVRTQTFSVIPTQPAEPSKDKEPIATNTKNEPNNTTAAVTPGVLPAWIGTTKAKGTPPPKALKVTSKGGQGTFKTIRNALLNGGSNSHIIILDPEHTEQLNIDGSQGLNNVTIEGWPVSTRPVVLSYPLYADVNKPLITINGAEGIQLKNLVLQGSNKDIEVVNCIGDCIGLTLVDLQIIGYQKQAMTFGNALGTKQLPIRVAGLHFQTNVETDSAIRFEGKCQHIIVERCRFVGPFRGAVSLNGELSNIEVKQSRFARNISGILYNSGVSRLTVSQSVFSEPRDAAFYFSQSMPGSATGWDVRDNLFLNTKRIALIRNVNLNAPKDVTAQWLWANDGQTSANTTVKSGTRYFRKEFVVPEVQAGAFLNISCKDKFVVYLNGQKAGESEGRFYNQRVYRLDVSKLLKQGPNAIAVQAVQEGVDPISSTTGSAAGLLVYLADREGRPILATDESWKVSRQPVEGWNQLGTLAGKDWEPVKPWVGEPVVFPWKFAVWDESVNTSLNNNLLPKFNCSNNYRDFQSWEGYPNIASVRGNIEATKQYGTNADDDATFLRYIRSLSLLKLGTSNGPVGLPQDQ